MTLRITTLMENHAIDEERYGHEHGLSFLVENDHGTVLFDTGQSDRFIDNARRMDVDFESIGHIALSHAHYDHTGGLTALLGMLRHRPQLWLSSTFFRPKFKQEGSSRRYIGSPFALEDLRDLNAQPEMVGTLPVEILPGIYLVSGFDRTDPFETPSPEFVYRIDGEYVTDPFEDEIALVARIKTGLVVLFGCGHPGTVNMLTSIEKRFGEPIQVLIGGTHLVHADAARIRHTIRIIESIGIGQIGLSHCTGQAATDLMREAFGSRFFSNHAGTRLIYD